MAQTDVIRTKWLQRTVIGYGMLMILVLVVLRITQDSNTVFGLIYNRYALISLAALLANLTIAYVVINSRAEFKSSEATWYFLFLGALIFFSSCEMLQRLSITSNAALFWAQLAGLGPAFEPVGLFLFSLLYVSRRTRSVALIPLVIIAGGVLYFFHGNGGLVFQTAGEAIKWYPWGYNNDIGSAFMLNALWALGLPLIALGMLLRFHRRSHNQILRRQSMLFVIALSFPIVGALLFDILAPVIGLQVPPLHSVFTVGTAGLMLYGLSHYKVFDVTPASLAGDILSTMSESVIVTDRQLKIELMNTSAEDMFGKSFVQVGGIVLPDLFGPRQATLIKQAVHKVTTANQTYTIGNYIIEEPRPINVRITAAKITEEHGAPGYVFAIADITELQKSYVALEQEKLSVDHKVEVRTKELREAQERLAETDQIKTEFVVLTSHNLRTPLTAIKGNLEFLTESKLNRDQKKFVSALETSTKRLGSLVEELLTISSIEAGDKIELEPLSLKDVLEPLLDEAKGLAKITGNKFSSEIPAGNIKIRADETRLQTAIHNLLDNAFKFTKQGTVKLTVSAEKEEVVIRVIDDGIGITANEVPKLFTKFHRSSGDGSKTSFDYTGQGIGLYLAKLIVEEHKGHIHVSSEPGHGSTFRINLPLNKTR
ncbi:MAG TPA: ATP-binding protein [Candidatus Saccharimonadales bacterium]|nr:ATP-binding protein [Candidatus Saccharimonadales bacterium]